MPPIARDRGGRPEGDQPSALRRRTWLLVLAAVLVSAFPLGAAEARTSPTVTLEAPVAAVSVGAPVALHGTVAGRLESASTVTLMQRAGARWKSIATADLAEDGAFTAVVTPGRPGSWQLLAQYKAGKLKVRSAVLVLEVVDVPSIWTAVSAGASSVTGVAGDGTLWTWGSNERGQLGIGDVDDDPHATPAAVGGATDWSAVSVGHDHTLALKSDGTLWAWGGGAEGQLGLGETTTTAASPTPVGDDDDWAAVAAGAYFSLALKTDGSLWSWGANRNGQLGLRDGTPRTSPTRVGHDADWRTVAAGWSHAMAVKADGSLWGWGFNGNGQLGVGDTRSRTVPAQVVGDTTTWRTVACGLGFTLAVSAGSELLCWGYNGNGQLGLGDTTSRLVPSRAGTRTDWSAVSAGRNHGLALRSDGTLWAFGWNGLGQLGIGGTEDELSPTRIGDARDWVALSAGGHASVGVKDDGSLWAWGANDLGQLGIGEADARDVPAPVGPASP